MRLAVDLADLLDLELLGLFLEDTGLHDLAGIPFAREFRPLGGGWRPLEVERLRQDLELAARSAERIFTKAVKHLPTKRRFEVIRGPTAEMVESISRTDDIVMVDRAGQSRPSAPAGNSPGSWRRPSTPQPRSSSCRPRIARAAGPVVAIAAGGEDPSIRTAAAIAIAAREGLIIVQPARTARTSHGSASSRSTLGCMSSMSLPAICACPIRQPAARPFAVCRSAWWS